jgi:hypothetical protein
VLRYNARALPRCSGRAFVKEGSMKHVSAFVLLSLSLAAGCSGGVPGGDDAGSSVFCGGIAGIPCPGGGRCVDDPSDNCDPTKGGADCGGVCECIETELCVRGSHFDSSPSVCACVADRGEPCGRTTCGAGTSCCNASCGTCVKPGMVCSQIACE